MYENRQNRVSLLYYMISLYTRYPFVAHRAWPSGSREQRYFAYKCCMQDDRVSCIQIQMISLSRELLDHKQKIEENKYFKKTSILFFTHIIQNNKNISISLDLIFFNKRRMIHHYSISSSEEFVRNTIFKKFLDHSLVYN